MAAHQICQQDICEQPVTYNKYLIRIVDTNLRVLEILQYL